MGRQKEFRQLTKQHTDSIAAKTSLHGLIQLVKTHCEISWPEADILGRMLYQFFVERSEHRAEGQIVFPVRWIPGHSGRNSPPLAEPIMARLTVFHPHDVELWRELGVKAMQQSRIVRLVGEALSQGGILSQGDIGLLTISAAKTIRETLKPLWQQGIKLPLMGMAKQFSSGMRYSVSEAAFTRLLNGEASAAIREDLHMSTSAWLALESEAERQVYAQDGELYEVWKQTPETSWTPRKQRTSKNETTSESYVYDQLTSYFGMSRAGADLLLDKVTDWLRVRSDTSRSDRQVVYYAVADYEPPGKALHECNLVPVVLNYVTDEDQGQFNQDAPRYLISERLKRFARQAYEQGGVLNQSDLAFLIGMSSDAIQTFVKTNEEFFPTRGNVVDIGPGLTHAKKIIQLFMEGYSESDIVKRTHHTYASVENYIDKFCKIVGLSDEGLSAVEIRIALGCSLNSVKGYLELKEAFDIREYRWTMAQIRARYAQKKTVLTLKRRHERK